jgi:hypothetical protein
MRDIEVEIFDQSDVIFASIAKKKKFDVQKIIDDLSFCSSQYSFIRVFFCKFQLSDDFRSKQQIFFFIFSLFIFYILFRIIAKHINIKTDLKRSEKIDKQRS